MLKGQCEPQVNSTKENSALPVTIERTARGDGGCGQVTNVYIQGQGGEGGAGLEGPQGPAPGN